MDERHDRRGFRGKVGKRIRHIDRLRDGGQRMRSSHSSLEECAPFAEQATEAVEDVTADLDALVERVSPVGQDIVGMIVRGVTDGREHFS